MRPVAESDVRSRNESQGERALRETKKNLHAELSCRALGLARRWLLGA